MKCFTVGILFLFWISFINNVTAQEERKVFCMYRKLISGGNFFIENINEQYCTHLIYGYMGIDDNNKIRSLTPNTDYDAIRKFNYKRNYNKLLKTLVAVGGWDSTESSQRYSEIFSKEENQDIFTRSVIDFLIKYNFNGIVLHWAYPGRFHSNSRSDKINFSSLLKKLKKEFNKYNFVLVAFCHGLSNIDNSYIVEDINDYVDYIFVQSYGFYGTWNKHIGISGPLYLHPNEIDRDLSVDSHIQNWLRNGVQSDKLVMGIGFFSNIFTLKYKNQTEPGSLHNGAGIKPKYNYENLISYIELCQKLKKDNWTVKWNDIQKSSYAYKDDQWISFENELSLKYKSNYVINNNLAGVLIVSVEDDDFLGVCGEKYALQKTLYKSLINNFNETDFQFIINVNIFKKNIRNKYSKCIFHKSNQLDII